MEWIEQTIQQLQKREFQSLDTEALIEELRELEKSEKRALESNLMVLLAHLLKLMVQKDAPATMKRSGYSSVIEHRKRIEKQLQRPLLCNLISTRFWNRLIQMVVKSRSRRGN